MEDQATQRNVFAFNLTNAGFRVTAAAEALKALQLAQHQHFDLALVDYYLPDCPGTNFVKQLRSIDGYEAVPIIMLTARTKELNLEYLTSKLCVLVLPKPCSMKRLVDTVSKCLEVARCAS